jgi:hypothetical protein
MPTALRSGRDEITAEGSYTSSPARTRTHLSPSNSSVVTLCSRRTWPPSFRMSSVIVSHIWPGPYRG